MRRRIPRNRQALEMEVGYWRTLFGHGYDFFGDLRTLGLHYDSGHEQEQLAEEIDAAWQRLGTAFLATWTPTPHRPRPWAEVQLGKPGDQTR